MSPCPYLNIGALVQFTPPANFFGKKSATNRKKIGEFVD